MPTALASNSPRSNVEAKISCHQGNSAKSDWAVAFLFMCWCYLLVSLFLPFIGWKESFTAIVGGDEVEKGKPSPYM